jgi:hypothetical protein
VIRSGRSFKKEQTSVERSRKNVRRSGEGPKKKYNAPGLSTPPNVKSQCQPFASS